MRQYKLIPENMTVTAFENRHTMKFFQINIKDIINQNIKKYA
jgi:hypothetical protein